MLWHGIFATANSKVASPKSLDSQIKMFREHGMGSFKTLLVELSRDPAMIAWLDNQDNHNGAINENYGRELLELFSMGVGNYSEEDIKECARAFTGWTIGNTEYMIMRSQRDSNRPYGRIGLHFEYRPEDHDDGEKVFLGERGRFDGDDVVDIICQHPATARFISRHLYHFFVADELPVTQWPYTPPRNPEAIETLCAAYFDNDYDMRSVLRVLFNSDFFRSRDSWYGKVKSPAELVAGVIRVTGDSQRPRLQMADQNVWMADMGQQLLNPPSVEGWHQGVEWVDTGNFVQRLNFASGQFGDVDNPGVRAMISGIASDGGDATSPERLVDACLDEIAPISVSNETKAVLVEFASQVGDLSVGSPVPGEPTSRRIGDLLAMEPNPGDTVVVSAASGAVGQVVGQISKIMGCRTVGLAGSQEKISFIVNELGFDAGINYKTGILSDMLADACPLGIDVYFDNVGGPITDAVMEQINTGARISVCGQISQYNLEEPDPGPRNMGALVVSQAKMEGFLVGKFANRFEAARHRIAGWIKQGKIQYKEDIAEGIENAPRAFIGMLRGENFGKLLIKVADE